MSDVIDLFAGPGGWDVAARAHGLDPLGIEWDDAACATRQAAGLRTLQADVASLDPKAVMREHFSSVGGRPRGDGYRPLVGLIASPPCQAWSMAGRGGGRRDKDLVVRCAGNLAAGTDTRAEYRSQCEDERSILAVEPLRWALELRPTWCAFEQVPPVLELWTMFAQILSLEGYSTWAGVLEAERYGVPQTRERAILIARRDGVAEPPRATHQRYVPGEPQRHDFAMDGEVLPWVSMAEALGWGMTERPGVTFAPGAAAGGGLPMAAVRERAARCPRPAHGELGYRLSRGSGMTDRDGARRPVPEDEPAPTITGLARSAEWVYVNGNQPNSARRGGHLPAPTVMFGHRMNDVKWERTATPPTHLDVRQTGARPRSVSAPAPTMLAQGLAKGVPVWIHERPATTVNGDPRVAAPGRHDPEESGSQYGEDTVRATVEEAAALQTFPPDYPWQGSRTKQFQQVGNAVPPLLAWHVLNAILTDARDVAA